jgi:hypothetical protein
MERFIFFLLALLAVAATSTVMYVAGRGDPLPALAVAMGGTGLAAWRALRYKAMR